MEEEDLAKETRGTTRDVSGKTGKHGITQSKREKGFKGKETNNLTPVLRVFLVCLL